VTWNFRILYHDKDEYPWYGVHEVFYNEDGNIYTYTENAMDLIGETEEYVKSYVDMVQKDINRLPILVESEIILAEPDYELEEKLE
jgi:hypothetical protein